MALLSRRRRISPFSFLMILILGSQLLLSTHPSDTASSILVTAAPDPATTDQLYNQHGFLQQWIAPMPDSPIGTSFSSSSGFTDGTANGRAKATAAEKFVVQNWSTTFKTISMGGNDIAFVENPFGGETVNNSMVMQVNYPKGSYAPSFGPVVGGTQFYAAPFGDKTPFSKMMVSYDVAFPNGFEWVLGGKLPGVYGGPPYDGCSGGVQSTGANCLTMRLMWRASGSGEVYAYVPADQKSHLCKSSDVLCSDQYGKSIGRGLIFFSPGAWHRIDMVMELNEPAGHHNGLLEVYLNGKQVISRNDIPYRTTGMVGFQGLMFSSFFGGSDPSYATPVDTQVYFKNVQLSVGEPATLYDGPGSGGARIKTIVGSEAMALLWSTIAVVMALLYS